jgi:hypothetical protein
MKLVENSPHIFKVVNKFAQIEEYKPNAIQRIIYQAIQEDVAKYGKARIIGVKGRQGGFSHGVALGALSYNLTVPAWKSYIMCHTDELATELLEKKIKFAINHLPEKFKYVLDEKAPIVIDNEHEITFGGELEKSTIKVGLSGRGGNWNLVHISEAGAMSMNPKLWKEMKDGTLDAGEKAEVIIIESTADGGKGAFYQMVQAALEGRNGYRVLFIPWWLTDEFRENPPDNDDWIDDYVRLSQRHSLNINPMNQYNIDKSQWFWYYRKLVDKQGDIKAQYPCTLEEAFEMNVEGSYYQDMIDQMNAEHRFEDNPEFAYNPRKLVTTWWDIAVKHDLNAIIFAQEVDGMINIFDYYETTGVGTQEIATEIFKKGYIFGKHYGPHDLQKSQMQLGAIRTNLELFREAGINFTVIPRSKSVLEDINIVRLMFPRIRIYKNENTTLLVNRLRSYRGQLDPKTNLTKEVVDESNHGADVFRYLCLTINLNQSDYYKPQTALPIKVLTHI